VGDQSQWVVEMLWPRPVIVCRDVTGWRAATRLVLNHAKVWPAPANTRATTIQLPVSSSVHHVYGFLSSDALDLFVPPIRCDPTFERHLFRCVSLHHVLFRARAWARRVVASALWNPNAHLRGQHQPQRCRHDVVSLSREEAQRLSRHGSCAQAVNCPQGKLRHDWKAAAPTNSQPRPILTTSRSNHAACSP
jgi:hypothetical protein